MSGFKNMMCSHLNLKRLFEKICVQKEKPVHFFFREKPNDLWEMKSLECDSIKEKDSWKEYSIIVDIPIDVKRLSVGLTLKGEGHIWFHSMKVEIIKEK